MPEIIDRTHEESDGWIQSWDEYSRLLNLHRDGITPLAFSDIKTGAYQLYDEDGKLWKIPEGMDRRRSDLESPILGKKLAERAYGIVVHPHSLDSNLSTLGRIDTMSFVHETPEDAMAAYAFSRHWVGRVW
ncbi:MAG: hypothetical protein PHY14_01555 [Candidatus Gracilibacteria bacterium]|nr:hypothetical protein [Candidatus Gracilibacteria bacterium]